MLFIPDASRVLRDPALAALCALACGCTLDRSGVPIGANDAGPRVDGSFDAGIDGGEAPDAGPPCPDFETESTVVANVPADRFAPTNEVAIDGPPAVMELAVSPYRYGVWAATGYSEALRDPPDLAELDVASRRESKLMEPEELLDLDGGPPPRGLGLNEDRTFTIEFEGEVRLDEGTRTIAISGRDGATAVIDAPSGALTLTSIEGGATASGEVVIGAGGAWIPVRAAMVARETDWGFSFLVDGRELEEPQTRVRADALVGREVFGFDGREQGRAYGGSRVDRSDTSRVDYRDDRNPEIGIDDANDWRILWLGRAFLEAGGGLVTGDADDYRYLFVDGLFHGSELTPTSLTAGAGWHDVVLSLEEGGGYAAMDLAYDERPLSTFRPALSFGGYANGNGVITSRYLSSSVSSISLPMGDSERALHRAIASVEVRSPDPSLVAVKWLTPRRDEAASYTLAGAERVVGGTDRFRHRFPFDVTGLDVEGDWDIQITQTSGAGSTFESAGLLLHETPIANPYPTTGVVASGPIELDDETEVTHVFAIGHAPPGAAIALRVRGAASLPALLSASFVDVGPDGALAASFRARVIELEVTLSGPGDLSPHLEELRVVGKRCSRCAPACPAGRVRAGLRHLYTFDDPAPNRVRDEAASAPPIDLYLVTSPEAGAVTALEDSALVLSGEAGGLRSAAPMSDLASATGLTVEAWVTAERPSGFPLNPLRILTLSGDESHRNFMLARDGANFVVRLRTSMFTSANGDPTEYFTGVVEAARQHVVMTHDGTNLAVYVDGVPVRSIGRAGDYTNWDPSYSLQVGNERLAPRPFEGRIHLIAIYGRALGADEVMANFVAGE